MLDKPEKTHKLMEILGAAVPFEVGMMPELIDRLAREQNPVVIKSVETVSKVSYSGDIGGIMCHIQPEDAESGVVVSLTHVRVLRKLRFAAAVLDYQRHRVKKLLKQSYN